MSTVTNRPTDNAASTTPIDIPRDFWLGQQPSAPQYQNIFNFGRNLSLNFMNVASIVLGLLQQLASQVASNASNPTATFGNQNPVFVQDGTNTTTLNNNKYDNDFLLSKFTEFKNSDAYPELQTRDFVTTKWGYEGSGSVLTAFYNYVTEKYPTAPARAEGLGNQEYVTVINNNTTKMANINGTDYSFSYLKSKLNDFENSSAYPNMSTFDLVTTPWGYQGSGSVLRAFYNYVLDTSGNNTSLATPVATAARAAAAEEIPASTAGTTGTPSSADSTPLEQLISEN